MKFKDFFVIGTDTDVGKTYVSTLLYKALRKYNFQYYKPIQSGCFLKDDELTAPDVDFLTKFVGISYDNSMVTYTLKEEVSPHLASEMEGTTIEIENIKNHYKELKKRIFKNHTNDNLAVINKMDLESLKLTEDIKSNKVYFSNSKDDLCYIENEFIYYKGNKLIDTKEIILKGMHNYQNIMAAIIVAKHYGVEDEIINKVVKEFKGVEHRLEFVRELDGKKYYNDSKATNLVSTQIALKSFDQDTLVILGGYERGQDFKELIPYLTNVKVILAIGENKDRVKKELSDYNVIVFETLKEAMLNIKDYDVEIVLLSPAAASWDQYKKFEERGEEFKNIVNSL